MLVAATGMGVASKGRKHPVRIGLAAAWLLGLLVVCLCWRADAAPAAVLPEPVAAAPNVPDQGRAWELLSPEEPMGAVLSAFKALADDGNRIVYETRNPIPGSTSGDGQNYNLARRTDGGWVNEQVRSPYPRRTLPVLLDAPELFDRNLEASILWSVIPADEPWWLNDQGVFRSEPDGTFNLIGLVKQDQATLIGATPDLGRAYFVDEAHLVPGDAGRLAGRSVFELEDGEIRQADVDSGGNLLFDCGAEVPYDSGISRDGKRVFIVGGFYCGGRGGVYLREDGATTEISTAACALPDCGGEPAPHFLGATPNGAHAYLFAETRLTAEDADPGPDLYRYDVESGELTLLTEMPGLAPTNTKVVPSPNGAAVAFGAVDEGGAEGMAILDGHGARFLATQPGFMEWSSDSRYLVFTTSLQLSPQDHDDQLDAYRYDSPAGSFTEISAGLAGTGNGSTAAELGGGASVGWLTSFFATNPYRAMSADGQRVFFTTAERLIPEDHNDALDVYEWANGQLGLISSGAGEGDATYLNATPDGRTVVFRAPQTLLRRDRDGGDYDYYAARIGGGFPEPSEPAAGCEGAQCRSAGTVPPSIAPPASGQAKLALRRPTASERTRFAASGWLELLAEAPHPGKLSAGASARLGSRTRPIGAAAVKVSEAGPVRLRLRLSSAARKALRRGKALRVRVALTMGKQDVAGASFSIRRKS